VSEVIWSYTGPNYCTDYRPLSTSYWYRGADGRLRLIQDWAWVDMNRGGEYETLRIEFDRDAVRSIEALRR
jgi:hypothetical protein